MRRFQNKIDCQPTSTCSYKCHFNVTCLVVCVSSNSNVSIAMWFFFTRHTTCQVIIECVYRCASCFVQVFACQMSKTCKNFVQKTHWLGYILGPTFNSSIRESTNNSSHSLTKRYLSFNCFYVTHHVL
jgi:hypothetical protein